MSRSAVSNYSYQAWGEGAPGWWAGHSLHLCVVAAPFLGPLWRQCSGWADGRSTFLLSAPALVDGLSSTHSMPIPVGPHHASTPGLFVSGFSYGSFQAPKPPCNPFTMSRSICVSLTKAASPSIQKLTVQSSAHWRDLRSPLSFRTILRGLFNDSSPF